MILFLGIGNILSQEKSLETAKTAYVNRDYVLAIKHYKKAIRKSDNLDTQKDIAWHIANSYYNMKQSGRLNLDKFCKQFRLPINQLYQVKAILQVYKINLVLNIPQEFTRFDNFPCQVQHSVICCFCLNSIIYINV